MFQDRGIQRLSLWLLAASLAVIVGLYGLPLIVHRVVVAVDRGHWDALDGHLKELSQTSELFRQVAGRVAPAVVSINNPVSSPNAGPGGARIDPTRSWLFGLETGVLGQHQAVGFVIDSRGFIVTSRQAVRGARQLRVRFLDGTERDAEIVGFDDQTDLAVLRADASGLVAVNFGDSNRARVGEWVLAIGNREGLEQSITAGIISATGRSELLDQLDVQDFLQTDAAFTPWNSGGPLVNLQGEVIGVNSAAFNRREVTAGVTFAIPSNIARTITGELIAHRKVTRGWFGIRAGGEPGHEGSVSVDREGGVRVSGVAPESPAEKAGIRPGDVILSVGENRISGLTELRRRLLSAPVGSTHQVEVFRGGQHLKLVAVIETPIPDLSWVEDQLGMSLRDLTPEIARRFALPRDRGALVIQVVPGHVADREGIQAGDIIESLDRREVLNVSQLLRMLQRSDQWKGMLMSIVDPRGDPRVVVLQRESPR